MSDYVGAVRSESLLDQAVRNLSFLKKKASDLLMARNGHELGRCLEALNLIDFGQAVIYAASQRKETRGTHHRTDYPFSNPFMDKRQFVKMRRDGRLVSKWRDVQK
jgi:succinate dehydrogenase/fumarate reductase flavoprotein subunit